MVTTTIHTSENLNTMFSYINVIEKEGKYIDKNIKAKIGFI